jgi:HD-GYP domain-containing protein (c-di-GMP phosphodiesterase class II)
MSNSEEPYNVHVLKESIEALNRAAEMREAHNTGHGEAVGRFAEIIGRAMSLPPDEVAELIYAARVHDVGKIFVPERILNKGGPLTEDEFYLVKMHPGVGAEIVATIPNSELVQKAVEHHHEAFDGSGYPANLKGDEIPLWARIISVADAYVNMTTDRAFAPAKNSDEALAELESFSGTRYDGMVVRILTRQLKAERASSRGD